MADTANQPRYPEVEVQLTGGDGNAFAILAAVNRAMKKHGIPEAEREAFRTEAMSGDYDNLLQTCLRWVTVE